MRGTAHYLNKKKIVKINFVRFPWAPDGVNTYTWLMHAALVHCCKHRQSHESNRKYAPFRQAYPIWSNGHRGREKDKRHRQLDLAHQQHDCVAFDSPINLGTSRLIRRERQANAAVCPTFPAHCLICCHFSPAVPWTHSNIQSTRENWLQSRQADDKKC